MNKKVYTELSTHNYERNGNERNLIPESGSEFVIGALITLAFLLAVFPDDHILIYT